MAKQIGDNFITGTYDNVCFYKMDGQYYVRMKSSLSGKKVKQSALFKRTMESAKQMGNASVIASGIYRTIAKDKRKVLWYRKMTGMAKLLFKKGECKENIIKELMKFVASVLPADNQDIKKYRIPQPVKLFAILPCVTTRTNRSLYLLKRKNCKGLVMIRSETKLIT